MKKSQVKKKVIIIGAGPGGLASAMILAHRGYEVVIYEKQSRVGGRTSAFEFEGFTFDLGPTFLMLKEVFEEVFELAGEKLSDHLELKRLDPLYRINYSDGRDFMVYDDKEKLKTEIARLFSGDEVGYDNFLKTQKKKFDRMYPCLKVPYMSPIHYLRLKLLRALPSMDVLSTVYGVISRYFINEDIKLAMTFQAKYLGMSPWQCPGPFTILPYIEHAFGIYHPIGGLHQLSEKMAQIARDKGVHIHLDSSVEKIQITGGRITGVELSGGEVDQGETVIMNADFAAGVSGLIPEKAQPKRWNKRALEKKSYSCSAFMIYLGLDTLYDIPHHNIFIPDNYKKNIEGLVNNEPLDQDPAFYVQNASVTDPNLAPEGRSTLYVLVPVSNLNSSTDWSREKDRYRDLVIDKLKKRAGLDDLEDRIVAERVVTPDNWQNDINVYKGAVFNLAHSIDQMLYLRPHNRFQGIDGLYLTGGGTHPGSGLPTILESARITAELIDKRS